MQLSVEELKGLLPDAKLDRRGKNLYATCPSCGQNEFGISLNDNHRFGCFRKKDCGFTGNIFTLLAYLGKSVHEVRPSLFPRTTLDIDKMLIHEQEVLDLQIADCPLPLGFRRLNSHPYLDSRGFLPDDYERYHVGQTIIDSRYKDFVIFGIKQFGEIKATVARSQKSKAEIDALNTMYKLKGLDKKALRYINSYSDFAKILLGVEELTPETDTVIVVEGLFDKQNTDRVLDLRSQQEVKCVATFKCGMSPEQKFLLQQSGVKNVVVMYDPDVISEIKEAAFDLDPYFNVHVGYCESGRDPGDMVGDDFDDVFAHLKSPSQFGAGKVTVPLLRKK